MPDNLMYTKQRYPGVAQLVARQLWELDAAGSNPVTRTTEGLCFDVIGVLFLFPAPYCIGLSSIRHDFCRNNVNYGVK